ncbi:OLC1v1009199C1 [Oldenlandia corymbosa var. corymbosa]|uniref:OLC1v1009199C1 n=1 Tax=Oldenlandia corymbosa var. corymbosa TaxID=529605 RepID=A0AAV1DNG7_OLDCO|nr:OLC1v1009199C1 [Oldenlandia corymbosa var. corymbosa]
MAKFVVLFALLVATVSAIASADVTSAGPPFYVKGSVFADQCRVAYEVYDKSKPSGLDHLSDVEVELKCTSGGQVTYSKGTKTDSKGDFLIEVERDCGDEICKVSLVSSPDSDYQDKCEGRDSCHVTITSNSGIVDKLRHCNALCYSRKTPESGCPQLLQQYQGLDESN